MPEHDPLKGPVVKGLSEHPVSSWHEVERFLDRGMESRTTAATAMNDRSSRSHAVVARALLTRSVPMASLGIPMIAIIVECCPPKAPFGLPLQI